ncbi:ABC-type antimicrobial peptide transport system permease subunit [Elusimicrobium posterum]|uniref:ABC transporter permease n=1 Tax=Elusimicrobium posterum TaxID=3116653 RepID=UPI003C70F064
MIFLTRILIAAKIGTAEILNNKMRSFLSIFAISIGVLTFLFVFSAVNYSKDKMKRALELGGPNTFTFDFWNDEKLKLDMTLYDEMMRKFPEAKSLSPTTRRVRIWGVTDFGEYNGIFMGITPNWKNTNWVYGKVKGRFINWDDIEQRRRVLVAIKHPVSNKGKTKYLSYSSGYGFGWDENDKWFKWFGYNKEMVGRTVRIMGNKFTVVGEIQAPYYKNDERLEVESWDFLVPITSMGDTAYWDRYFAKLEVDARSEKDIEPLKNKMINYFRLREGNRKAEYQVKTFKDEAEQKLESIRQNILLISVLGAIAMISGGIGIMNVVLATIYARTKEIGTRRALGATKGDIFMQFSFESVVLSLFGAVAGYGLSFFALDYMAQKLSMQAKLDVFSVLMAFGLAALTGFLFSLYPSLKAANMNPVDALKVE